MIARLVLVGAPGSGKSQIAAELAQRWGAECLDTDDMYLQRFGQTVGEAVVADESAFRGEEERIASGALAADGAVVALGSGAVLSENVRNALAACRVVWLQVGLADSVRRSGLSGPRPMALGNVRGQLQTMLEQRAGLYQQVADFLVDTDSRDVASVADEIEQWEAGP